MFFNSYHFEIRVYKFKEKISTNYLGNSKQNSKSYLQNSKSYLSRQTRIRLNKLKRKYQNQVKRYVNYDSIKLSLIADKTTFMCQQNSCPKQLFILSTTRNLSMETWKIRFD